MGHNRNLADYAHHFDGTNIDLGSGNIETEGVVTFEDVSNVDAVGVVTARAGVKVPDNQKVFLGTGDDLQVYHDGTDTWIDNDEGDLYIRNTGDDIIIRAADDVLIQTQASEGAIIARGDGQVELYHNNSKKLETTTTGATVTGTLVSDGVTSELDLSAISASISDTAVDVFVYDTSKDSDGGAWRKRTQHTSWYNETLNTATRGSRREFPSVAVIVAEVEKLTIYDGDDPDLPMWMVFLSPSTTPYNLIPNVSGDITSIAALNGKISLGYHHNYGLGVWDFISEFCICAWRENSRLQYAGTIAERNGQKGTISLGAPYILTYVVNDVAMTVLPNAPIDSATRLPVPTTAVATPSGLSVIKDDGNVWDDTSSGGVTAGVASVEFVNDTLYYGRGGAGGNLYVKTSIGSVSANFSSSHWYRYQAGGYGEVSGVYLKTNNEITVTKNKNDVALSGDTSLVLLEDKTTSSLVAYATTSFNTGWMHGNIKGAFLSDTDTTNLTGGNKVTNGDAWTGAQSSTSTTPPTGWTGGNGAQWRTESGGDGSYIRLVNAGSSQGGPNSYMSQAITTVVGKKYKISVTQYHHATISVFFRAGTAETYSDLVQNSWTSSSSNTPRYEQNTFTATGTTTYITLGIVSGTNNYGVGWDDVVVTEVDEDRSVNANGLHSYGTITKQPVATGAELVSYSGWSASNSLIQPYNTAFNWGTNTWSLSFWIDPNGGTGPIIGHGDDSNDGFLVDIHSVSGVYYVDPGYLSNSGGFARNNGNNGGALIDGWNHVTIIDKSQRFYVYVNGVLHDFNWDHGAANWTSRWTSPFTRIGGRTTGGIGGFTGNGSSNIRVALVRFSQSEPSAEQIKKMYEDEKVLFQENAKCTLYGSSDAVTALAYDEVTEQLHVGNSSGRSDFQGLRRINNTTTAVTTAISAHDEFIIEQ